MIRQLRRVFLSATLVGNDGSQYCYDAELSVKPSA